MLMVDLWKAFDTFSWSFLINLLHWLGFPSCTISWIRECITTTTSSIFLNGKMHVHIYNKRGLWQGDPLSPYMFVLAMDNLSRILKVNAANPDFNYHPKYGKIELTHLAFADDIVLFSRGDYESVNVLTKYLQRFALASGLELNLNKSKLFPAGVSDTELSMLQQATGFSFGDFPVCYLGTHLAYGKMKVAHFNPLIKRISNFIKS